MTIERRLVADIKDIKGVCFKCESCGLRHTVPPDKIGDIPRKCPRCQNTWIHFPPSAHTPEAIPFVDLASSIERVWEMDNSKDGPKPGFRILLEFEAPQE